MNPNDGTAFEPVGVREAAVSHQLHAWVLIPDIMGCSCTSLEEPVRPDALQQAALIDSHFPLRWDEMTPRAGCDVAPLCWSVNQRQTVSSSCSTLVKAEKRFLLSLPA